MIHLHLIFQKNLHIKKTRMCFNLHNILVITGAVTWPQPEESSKVIQSWYTPSRLRTESVIITADFWERVDVPGIIITTCKILVFRNVAYMYLIINQRLHFHFPVASNTVCDTQDDISLDKYIYSIKLPLHLAVWL